MVLGSSKLINFFVWNLNSDFFATWHTQAYTHTQAHAHTQTHTRTHTQTHYTLS
jgi:hypothetical protein